MCQVNCLPSSYNGDIVFELPPIGDDAKRGDRVQCMERAKDYYYWTRIVLTSANVPTYNLKNVWQLRKMACTGALECKNDRCDYYSRHGLQNASAWMGNYKMAVIHKVGEQVQEGGLLCSFCSQRPYCTATCQATMFYM
jgi:hypothetical protein